MSAAVKTVPVRASAPAAPTFEADRAAGQTAGYEAEVEVDLGMAYRLMSFAYWAQRARTLSDDLVTAAEIDPRLVELLREHNIAWRDAMPESNEMTGLCDLLCHARALVAQHAGEGVRS